MLQVTFLYASGLVAAMGEYFSILAGPRPGGVGGVSVVHVLSSSDESTVMSNNFDLTGAAGFGYVSG